MDFEEFKGYCTKGVCLRKTIKSRKCETDYKKEACFTKYCKQEAKNKDKRSGISKTKKAEKDRLWEEAKEKVWLRDVGFYLGSSTLGKHDEWKKYCRLWKCLSESEKKVCEFNLESQFWLNKTLDVAHIVSRAKSKELYYEPDNLLLIGNLFHSLLDTYKSPVTGKPISKDIRDYWFDRIKKGV